MGSIDAFFFSPLRLVEKYKFLPTFQIGSFIKYISLCRLKKMKTSDFYLLRPSDIVSVLLL